MARQRQADALTKSEVVALTRSKLLVAGHKDTFAEDGLLDLAAWLNLLEQYTYRYPLQKLPNLSRFRNPPTIATLSVLRPLCMYGMHLPAMSVCS